MSFHLRIFVMGLVALVPSEDRTDLTVVLQEARHHDHYPLLVYECENVYPRTADCERSDDPNLPDERVRRFLRSKSVIRNGNASSSAVVFEGQELKISGLVRGKLLFNSSWDADWWHRVTGVVPESRTELHSFSWVPEMAKVSPAAGRIARRHLYEPNASEVAGLLWLEGIEGTVQSYGLANLRNEIRSLTFKNSNQDLPVWDFKQALTDILMIDVPIDGDTVELTFKGFSGGEIKRKLKPREWDRTVDVLLANIGPIPEYCPEDEEAHHFAFYYDLAEQQNVEREIPEVGRARIESAGLEPPLPRVIQFVGEGSCLRRVASLASRAGGVLMGSSRPICTVVVFESP